MALYPVVTKQTVSSAMFLPVRPAMWGHETRGTMTADGCVTLGGHRCCLRTWTEGSCSSCTGNIWARVREVVWPWNASFILTLPLFILKLVPQRLSWRAAHWAHASSHGNGCSAHCSRKVRQFTGFIFSLYHSRALAWHDPQIIWMPENPKPALYSFFVFMSLFSSP